MIITFPPRPLELLDLAVVETAADGLLQLLPANLGQRLFLFGRFDLGLVARLHADAQRRVEGYRVGVAADFVACRRSRGRCGCLDGEKCIAECLNLKCTGCVSRGDNAESFER